MVFLKSINALINKFLVRWHIFSEIYPPCVFWKTESLTFRKNSLLHNFLRIFELALKFVIFAVNLGQATLRPGDFVADSGFIHLILQIINMTRCIAAIKFFFHSFKSSCFDVVAWSPHSTIVYIGRIVDCVLRPGCCLILFAHLKCPLKPSRLTGFFNTFLYVTAYRVINLVFLILGRSKW